MSDKYLTFFVFVNKGANGTSEVVEPLLVHSDDPPPFTLTVANEGLVSANNVSPKSNTNADNNLMINCRCKF